MKDDALKLIDGMVPFLQFQSTLGFLQAPPNGYPLPPTDILGGVQKVRDNVVKGSYKGEYDFQLDLWDTLNSAHDGHLSWKGDALDSVLKYEVGWDVVSVSSDGKALPSVYLLGKSSFFTRRGKVVSAAHYYLCWKSNAYGQRLRKEYSPREQY